MNDVRWKQRFDNYGKAFQTLVEAVELASTRKLSNLEEQGIIQSFEFTHELAWNVLKDYLEHKGFTNIVGSRDATRLAFKNNLIEDGDVWMKMIETRNRTSHTYNMGLAKEMLKDILQQFFPAFEKMLKSFVKLHEKGDENS